MNSPEEQPSAVAAVSDDSHEDLQRRLAERAEAVAARDAFIAVVAHELRNPMTPIVGQVDLLLAAVRAGKCAPEQVEQRLERIQHAVRRYMRRATVLLDVSRITSGKRQLELEAFDLAALLRDVAGEYAEAARHAGASVTVAAAEGLPVTWDRVATEQIIDNLLSNALKYGGRTPVEMSAAVLGEQVQVQIRDHGTGIPAGDRERVFGRFERAVGHGERQSGFGIGLWVVARLVAAMEGTIAIGDAPGGGALFTVTLPRDLEERHQ
jgi:two-component system OmpR family sensor kinase